VTRYVIDAPTLLHLVANQVQVGEGHQLVAPNLIRSQALTLLLTAVRRAELTEQEALVRHERLTELKLRLLGNRVSRRTAWKIARAGLGHDLRRGVPGRHQALGRCARHGRPGDGGKAEGIVPLAPLDALAADCGSSVTPPTTFP
jgi:hypothetical protein